MGFGDLKSDAGIKSLNDFLVDKSYIEGFVPSAADAVVFDAISAAPNAKYNHALRWYNHIKSYGSETAKFVGAKKALTAYGPAGGAKPAAAAAASDDDDDDDDIDLFGSDDEVDEEAEKIKAERLAAYAEKKSKKPALIAKSNVILDIKPWDDETDIVEMERLIRTIEKEGLLWGKAEKKPIAFGIFKLTISAVVEDDKVSVDWMEEQIFEFEDYVQSVDVAAFQKI